MCIPRFEVFFTARGFGRRSSWSSYRICVVVIHAIVFAFNTLWVREPGNANVWWYERRGEGIASPSLLECKSLTIQVHETSEGLEKIIFLFMYYENWNKEENPKKLLFLKFKKTINFFFVLSEAAKPIWATN